MKTKTLFLGLCAALISCSSAIDEKLFLDNANQSVFTAFLNESSESILSNSNEKQPLVIITSSIGSDGDTLLQFSAVDHAIIVQSHTDRFVRAAQFSGTNVLVDGDKAILERSIFNESAFDNKVLKAIEKEALYSANKDNLHILDSRKYVLIGNKLYPRDENINEHPKKEKKVRLFKREDDNAYVVLSSHPKLIELYDEDALYIGEWTSDGNRIQVTKIISVIAGKKDNETTSALDWSDGFVFPFPVFLLEENTLIELLVEDPVFFDANPVWTEI